MDDRELLEMAAKAARLTLDWNDGKPQIESGSKLDEANYQVVKYKRWNPLTDDGDALRLGVQLKLDIAVDDYAQVSWWSGQGSLQWVNEYCCRRAIVRAAAEIGRSMP